MVQQQRAENRNSTNTPAILYQIDADKLPPIGASGATVSAHRSPKVVFPGAFSGRDSRLGRALGPAAPADRPGISRLDLRVAGHSVDACGGVIGMPPCAALSVERSLIRSLVDHKWRIRVSRDLVALPAPRPRRNQAMVGQRRDVSRHYSGVHAVRLKNSMRPKNSRGQTS